MNQYTFSRPQGRASDSAKLPWRDDVRKLLHQVQFDSNPMLGIDRVLNLIVYADKQSTPRDYLNAITLALASEQLLSELLPHFRHEAVVRQFLAALKHRLENDQERR